MIICVPTPLNKTKDPDTSMVVNATKIIRDHIISNKDILVILESTVYPRFTREVMADILGYTIDGNILVAFSPERVDPGNKKFNVGNTPKLLGGIDETSLKASSDFYKSIIPNITCVSSCDVAEMAKVVENTFRMVNIGLANETAIECKKLGLDVWEVIEAAATKPFGFMPFWPGPGVGGHCLDKNEWIYYRYNGYINIDPVWKIWDKFKTDEGNITNIPDFELLSIDEKGNIEWNRVSAMSKRCFSGDMINIKTNYGYTLCVTEDHPMLVMNDNEINTQEALKIQIKDRIPFLYKNITNRIDIPIIDVISNMSEDRINKARIRLKNRKWLEFKKEIYSICKNVTKYDYISDNYLPLKVFLELERYYGFNLRDEAIVETGIGPSFSRIPAKISFDDDFSRLVGYFLSEGCLTEEKHIPRIRLTFGTHEEEYIEDVKTILNKMGVSFSTHIQDNSYHIRVSSAVLGFIFRDILKCGHDCYNKKIPSMVFDLPQEQKRNLLGALIKGDGYCGGSIGKKIYKKGIKTYFHNCNSAHASFFSSSEYLARGVVFLMQSLGILARVHKNESGFFVDIGGGTAAVYNCVDFLGKQKGGKIEKIFNNKIRDIAARNVKKHGEITSVPVTNISKEKVINREVFSFDVEKSHTFCAGFGCFVHNCICLDPHYLAWKLRSFNYRSKFIEVAEQINSSMPEYVVRMAIDSLSSMYGKAILNSKVLILGVAYKPDVSDVRESPALDIIQLLSEHGAIVDFFDPNIESIRLENKSTLFRVYDLMPCIDDYDCVIIVTNHSDVDYEKVCEHSKLIIDSRNATKNVDKEIKWNVVLI